MAAKAPGTHPGATLTCRVTLGKAPPLSGLESAAGLTVPGVRQGLRPVTAAFWSQQPQEVMSG